MREEPDVESRVLLLATGDTIAYSTGAGREGVASGAQLLADVPQRWRAARVVAEDVPAEPSWDMSTATMLALARRARSALVDDGFDGVVVSHGADTLEETAYLTDLLAGPAVSRGTIVFTSAVRQRDALSADGPRNLAGAIAAAADPALRGAGVLACLDDELHAARWVRRVDATTVRGFSSAPYPLLGRVVDAGGDRAGLRVEPLGNPPPRPPVAHGEPETGVAVVRTYPGMGAEQLTAVVDAGARGVVLEGTGPGNIPVSLFAAIGDLLEWDIPVVVASVCRTREVDLTELPPPAGLAGRLGVVGARGLPATKARYALMVALGGATRFGGGVAAARDWFGRIEPTGPAAGGHPG